MGFSSSELAKFDQAGKALSEATGTTLEEWAVGETGLILMKWAAGVRVAPVAGTVIRGRDRTNHQLGISRAQNSSFSSNPLGISVNTGKRYGTPGRVWSRNSLTKKWFLIGLISGDESFSPNPDRGPSAVRNFLTASAQKYAGVVGPMVKAGLKARALAKKSVVQIGDALGIQLSGSGIDQARSAEASDGKFYQNGTGLKTKTETSFSIEGVNTYPQISRAKLDTAFEAAWGERIQLAEAVLSKNLLKSTYATAQAFPYVQISR